MHNFMNSAEYRADRTRRYRIAARISHARRIDCDMSIEELAKRCGISRQRMSEIDDGLIDVTVAELRRIATALNTTPEKLNRPACTHVRVELETP